MSATLRERLIWNGCVGLVTVFIGLNGTAYGAWAVLLIGLTIIAAIGLGPWFIAWLHSVAYVWQGGNTEPDH